MITKMNKLFIIPIFRKLIDPNSRALVVRGLKNDTDKSAPKKKVWENRVTLISPDDSISIMDLLNAKSLAERRNLKLVKIEDENTKTRRPVYKLMTNAEYHDEELQKRKEKKEERQNQQKGDKVMPISSRIGQHDLMTRINNMAKWLKKKYEVRVVISGDSDDNMKTCESISSIIENNIKQHGKIVQKRTKGNTIRFQVLPDLTKDTPDNSNQSGPDCDDVNKDTGKHGPL